MANLRQKIEDKMNDYNVRKKLMILYLCCVLLPLFVTDSVIMGILLRGEKAERQYQMENIAGAVQSDLIYMLEEAANATKNIYVNRNISEFLDYEYESGYAYYSANQKLMSAAIFSFNSNVSSIVMYGDNETIVNGGHFSSISSINREPWYKKLHDSEQDLILDFYYVGKSDPSASSMRKISLVRRLNYFKDSNKEKLVKLDLDYSTVVRRLVNMKYGMQVYVCTGDKILFSNAGHSSNMADYEYLTGKEKIDYELKWSIYGEDMRILIVQSENTIILQIWNHLPVILFMLAVNIILPWLLTYIINLSFTSRLKELSQAFDGMDGENLKEIRNIRGRDEIGSLMRNYNRMVRRSQELIKTVYRDKLERQEMDIARQNAELLALHSQINPHFLFNVLESIRMHSIIKKEEETAGMIERLAVLERQNADWSSDFISIQEELKFIEAYLELQKYRFGDRLSYVITAEPETCGYCIPKLTLVTFVENACVHGAERKAAACHIYIRVYHKAGVLYLEVEDTGDGMEEEELQSLRKKMAFCSIEMIKENLHFGMINACLRLKLVTKGKAQIELDSEKGIGTCILIRIPDKDCKHG